MNKKTAKYWAYLEVTEEICGMLADFDSRGGHKKVGDEVEILLKTLQRKMEKMPGPEYEFDGNTIKT